MGTGWSYWSGVTGITFISLVSLVSFGALLASDGVEFGDDGWCEGIFSDGTWGDGRSGDRAWLEMASGDSTVLELGSTDGVWFEGTGGGVGDEEVVVEDVSPLVVVLSWGW